MIWTDCTGKQKGTQHHLLACPLYVTGKTINDNLVGASTSIEMDCMKTNPHVN